MRPTDRLGTLSKTSGGAEEDAAEGSDVVGVDVSGAAVVGAADNTLAVEVCEAVEDPILAIGDAAGAVEVAEKTGAAKAKRKQVKKTRRTRREDIVAEKTG